MLPQLISVEEILSHHESAIDGKLPAPEKLSGGLILRLLARLCQKKNIPVARITHSAFKTPGNGYEPHMFLVKTTGTPPSNLNFASSVEIGIPHFVALNDKGRIAFQQGKIEVAA